MHIPSRSFSADRSICVGRGGTERDIVSRTPKPGGRRFERCYSCQPLIVCSKINGCDRLRKVGETIFVPDLFLLALQRDQEHSLAGKVLLLSGADVDLGHRHSGPVEHGHGLTSGGAVRGGDGRAGLLEDRVPDRARAHNHSHSFSGTVPGGGRGCSRPSSITRRSSRISSRD